MDKARDKEMNFTGSLFPESQLWRLALDFLFIALKIDCLTLSRVDRKHRLQSRLEPMLQAIPYFHDSLVGSRP